MTAIAAVTVFQAHGATLTTHPRLWITQADLPRLRSWAVNSNPIYKNGLLAAANTAAAHADKHWNYTAGKPDSGWQDDGDVNWEGDDTEAYAEFFAFMSLIDPSPAKRDGLGQPGACPADVSDEPGGAAGQGRQAVLRARLHHL